jgi:2-C-methyl-D-erythritol 4-phosphate cytidylyltransferase
MIGAVIVAAGEGKRMGGSARKQFARVGGKPMIAYTLEVFEALDLVDHMVVVVPRDSTEWVREEVIEAYGFKKVHAVVGGGEARQQSVYNGLKGLKDKTTIAVIHDAVRPLVSEALLRRVIDAARKTGAAITAVPARDTVKQVESGQIVGTLDRRLLWLAQTPQAFAYNAIADAHRKAAEEHFTATDDASLLEKYGTKVTVAVGSYSNLKITSPEDMPIFEYFLKQENRSKLHAAQRRPQGARGRRGDKGQKAGEAGQKGKGQKSQGKRNRQRPPRRKRSRQRPRRR